MPEFNCAWGCDICQKVCPMNRAARVTPIEAFYETARPHVSPDDSIEGRAFAWRGKKVIERNLNAILKK
jgi:epoxyqueuosine reductase QueG